MKLYSNQDISGILKECRKGGYNVNATRNRIIIKQDNMLYFVACKINNYWVSNI
jgi:hypothetical protein